MAQEVGARCDSYDGTLGARQRLFLLYIPFDGEMGYVCRVCRGVWWCSQLTRRCACDRQLERGS